MLVYISTNYRSQVESEQADRDRFPARLDACWNDYDSSNAQLNRLETEKSDIFFATPGIYKDCLTWQFSRQIITHGTSKVVFFFTKRTVFLLSIIFQVTRNCCAILRAVAIFIFCAKNRYRC